jgi:Icc-related predicted phosphoesterase
MKLVIISDTHNKHKQVKIPAGDVLVVPGDFTGRGFSGEVDSFRKWLLSLSFKKKVVIAGNHDLSFEDTPEKAQELLLKNNDGSIIFLQDSEVTVDDVRFYGSPWQPRFFDWAFNLDRGSSQLRDKWRKIPDGIDVLITHCPPYGIMDPSLDGLPVGCELLLEELMRIKPKLHVFGHLHSGFGIVEKNGIIFVNAAMCDEQYQIHREPIVVDL